jgi:hypothetical protein
VSTRDGLEAALAASWDRETLAVYADHLQALGDPRGELIALDLELATRSSPELVARRVSLMTGWLGRLVPSNPHTPWIGDSFRFGFVEDLVLEAGEDAAGRLTQVLDSPLAPYLKRVTVRGDREHVGAMLQALSETQHGWLLELVVRMWGGTPVAADAVAGFIAATPLLQRLDVHGETVFESFPHPQVRQLRITGRNALLGIFVGDMPAVTELDLGFDLPYDPQHYTTPSVAAIETIQLAALRRLDLSRNEPEALQMTYGHPETEDYDDYNDHAPEGTVTRPLEVLRRQPVRAQLTHLKLPSIRAHAELELLEAIVKDMRALEEIEIARAHYFKLPAKLAHSSARFVRPASWPWPPVAEIPVGDALHVLVPGSRSGDTVAIADAAAKMERLFEDLDADARYAWTRFWVFVEQLGALPWKSDPHRTWTEDRAFPAELLVAALEACDVGGSGGWRELRDELRFRRPFAAEAMLTIHRVRTL